MKIFTLLFDTNGNGQYVKAFKEKSKAIEFLENWDNDLDMNSIITEIEKEGYYYCDDKEFSIILESHNLWKLN